jgi:2-hydroxy-3-keto-5-methylthiopentenyl-1-phosphate phosphatase
MRLVLDWDGTCTERDVGVMVMERFGDMTLYDRIPSLGGGLTHDEILALEFATVTAPYEDVLEFVLAEARMRAGFHELVERYRPLVISGTFHELIEPVLEREGVSVELLANRVEPRPDGWRVTLRDGAVCDSCREGCKRAALPEGDVVYVGDGYSDRCAALAASRVFARDALAAYLDERGADYMPFETLEDVVAGLSRAA